MPLSATDDIRVSEHIVDKGSDYYSQLLNDIKAAEHNVHLEAYIFDDDAVGQQILAALNDAAQRGVQVRIIVDGLGSYYAIDALITALADSPAELRIYHPSPWQLRAYKFALGKPQRTARFIDLLVRLNRRDHRKLCIIDDAVAWIGSMNISVVHTDNHEPPWRDYMVRIGNHLVQPLAESFNHLWYNRRPRHHASFLRQYFSSLSPKNRLVKNRSLVRLLNSSKQRLWITSAYFSPNGRLLRAIKRAAKRGIDVRLTVPATSDIGFFPALSATYYSDLLRHGVKVYEYRAGILHAKVMLIDDLCLIGSSNLNHRSLLHDLELDVLLSSKQTITTMTHLLQQDRDNATEVTTSRLPRYQLSIIMGWLPRLLRYWL